MKSKFRNFTKDEIRAAAQTNLVDFLRSIGQKVEKRGSNYFWTGGGNNSLAIFGSNLNLYKHFGPDEPAKNAIHFCREKLGMTFREAVEALLGGRHASQTYAPTLCINAHAPAARCDDASADERPCFVPPSMDSCMDKLYAYLAGERKISRIIINDFIQNDSLYQTKEFTKPKAATDSQKATKGQMPYSNIAFIAKDFEGNAVGAIKRAFPPYNFKGNHENSRLGQFCFRHEGSSTSKRLFVFEAPIDMLSYITMMRNDDIKHGHSENRWKENHFLAIGSVASGPLLHYIQNRDIDYVFLSFDNDRAGIEGRIKAVQKLEEAGYVGRMACHFSCGKDWNEDLMSGIVSADGFYGSSSNLAPVMAKLESRLEMSLGNQGTILNNQPRVKEDFNAI